MFLMTVIIGSSPITVDIDAPIPSYVPTGHSISQTWALIIPKDVLVNVDIQPQYFSVSQVYNFPPLCQTIPLQQVPEEKLNHEKRFFIFYFF